MLFSLKGHLDPLIHQMINSNAQVYAEDHKTTALKKLWKTYEATKVLITVTENDTLASTNLQVPVERLESVFKLANLHFKAFETFESKI